MTEGQKLRRFVQDILRANKSKLSTSQRMVLDDNDGGSYEPSSSKELLGEIITLEKSKNWSELIAVYKKLPAIDTSDKATPYLNGTLCTMSDYLKADILPGRREIRFNNPMKAKQSHKPYLNMSLEEFAETAYGDTLFTGAAGNGIFGGGKVASSNYRKVKSPNPVAFELITKKVIDKELLKNYRRGKYKDLKEVHKSKRIDELLVYLTTVLIAELVDVYLLSVWCKYTEAKAHKQSSPSRVKPTPKIKPNELTTIELTDKQFDEVENNVTLLGVSKSGALLHPRDKTSFKNSKHSK